MRCFAYGQSSLSEAPDTGCLPPTCTAIPWKQKKTQKLDSQNRVKTFCSGCLCSPLPAGRYTRYTRSDFENVLKSTQARQCSCQKPAFFTCAFFRLVSKFLQAHPHLHRLCRAVTSKCLFVPSFPPLQAPWCKEWMQLERSRNWRSHTLIIGCDN
jgi:hypothetical protein